MMLTFYNQRTAKDLGRVWVEDGELRCNTVAVKSLTEDWTGTPQGFMEHYRNWANAYLYVRESE